MSILDFCGSNYIHKVEILHCFKGTVLTIEKNTFKNGQDNVTTLEWLRDTSENVFDLFFFLIQ